MQGGVPGIPHDPGHEIPSAESVKRQDSPRSEMMSDRSLSGPDESPEAKHPTWAFLHILGSGGVALRGKGLSVFRNRPRQQIISAERGLAQC